MQKWEIYEQYGVFTADQHFRFFVFCKIKTKFEMEKIF